MGAVINLLEYLDGCSCVLALPLGPLTDLWYYNRPMFTRRFNYDQWLGQMRAVAPVAFQGFSGGQHPMIKGGRGLVAESARDGQDRGRPPDDPAKTGAPGPADAVGHGEATGCDADG